MRHQSKAHNESGSSISKYVAVMGILNIILEKVSRALPQIREASRMLPEGASTLKTGVGGIGESSVQR